LTDSTYKEQFYLELDKGQLLRTIGKTMMARDAYVHLDDCQLDAPEQAALNNWLYEVDQELSIGQQYLEEQLSPNEIIIAVDTTNYEVPATFESSNYYFGMWINSPNDLTFMTCGGDPEFRILQSKKTVSHWQLYPNPTTSVSWLKGKLMLGTLIDIFDIHGKIISHMVIDNDDQDVYLMDSVDGLSSGVYQVQIRQGDLRETLRLIKE
jgi:Secretion system C-terminal sorting domain